MINFTRHSSKKNLEFLLMEKKESPLSKNQLFSRLNLFGKPDMAAISLLFHTKKIVSVESETL